MEGWPKYVYEKNMQTTYSCYTYISLSKSIHFLIWSSGVTLLSWSNFGKSFSRCFGNGCCELDTAMASTTNQGLFAAMMDRKLKFGLGNKGLVQGGLVLGGLGGLESPASTLGKSWKAESTLGKLRIFWDLGSSFSLLSELALVSFTSCFYFYLVSI